MALTVRVKVVGCAQHCRLRPHALLGSGSPAVGWGQHHLPTSQGCCEEQCQLWFLFVLKIRDFINSFAISLYSVYLSYLISTPSQLLPHSCPLPDPSPLCPLYFSLKQFFVYLAFLLSHGIFTSCTPILLTSWSPPSVRCFNA